LIVLLPQFLAYTSLLLLQEKTLAEAKIGRRLHGSCMWYMLSENGGEQENNTGEGK
jgi:hypothetical protein